MASIRFVVKSLLFGRHRDDILAGTPESQSNLSSPTQPIQLKEDLVPRQLGTFADDIFQKTAVRASQYLQDPGG